MTEEQAPSEQRGGTTPDEAEAGQKGEWAGQAGEGIVPAELGGSDAPRELLDEDPELESSVLGRTTGSDEPATEGGIDLGAGDAADATTDGGNTPAGGRGARHEGHRRPHPPAEHRQRGRLGKRFAQPAASTIPGRCFSPAGSRPILGNAPSVPPAGCRSRCVADAGRRRSTSRRPLHGRDGRQAPCDEHAGGPCRVPRPHAAPARDPSHDRPLVRRVGGPRGRPGGGCRPPRCAAQARPPRSRAPAAAPAAATSASGSSRAGGARGHRAYRRAERGRAERGSGCGRPARRPRPAQLHRRSRARCRLPAPSPRRPLSPPALRHRHALARPTSGSIRPRVTTTATAPPAPPPCAP